MANLASRTDLKNYCLRRLGKPVIEINVDPQQIEDRIDDALQFFGDYHHEGSERMFLSHAITNTDITNGFIDLSGEDSTILSVIRVLKINANSSGMFDVKYQFMLNQMYSIGSVDLAHYNIMKSYLSLLSDYLEPEKSLEFNRNDGKLHIHMDWSESVTTGDYIVIECWRIMDPSTVPGIYNNRFLKDYATALIKRQWGENLKKYSGVAMIGGIQFSGQAIYDEAVTEIHALQDKMQSYYEEPPQFFVG